MLNLGTWWRSASRSSRFIPGCSFVMMQDGHQRHVEHLDSSLAGYRRVTGLRLPTLRKVVVPSLPTIRPVLPWRQRHYDPSTSQKTLQWHRWHNLKYHKSNIPWRFYTIYLPCKRYIQIRYLLPTNPIHVSKWNMLWNPLVIKLV